MPDNATVRSLRFSEVSGMFMLPMRSFSRKTNLPRVLSQLPQPVGLVFSTSSKGWESGSGVQHRHVSAEWTVNSHFTAGKNDFMCALDGRLLWPPNVCVFVCLGWGKKEKEWGEKEGIWNQSVSHKHRALCISVSQIHNTASTCWRSVWRVNKHVFVMFIVSGLRFYHRA